MKSPFPWFGGKSQIAHEVWARFGDVQNYVEPFFGSGAVLLNRPENHKGRIETVNDMDGWLTNFWRAVKHDPDAVANYANWPVNEVDLAARRDWLFSHKDHEEKMWRDPDYYDAKFAGYWVWGVCSTIGNAWKEKSTHLGAGMGIHRARTHLGAGMGIHRARTHLGGGRGIHRAGTHLGDAGRGTAIKEMFGQLSARLECVRVMCGDWKRVTSPSVTTHNGLTAMFLDPPYFDGCQDDVYTHKTDVRGEVREYALKHGDEMRIAVCGYEGEHNFPDDWECMAWKARGGYGSQSENEARENCKRERIWFSPACLRVTLF